MDSAGTSMLLGMRASVLILSLLGPMVPSLAQAQVADRPNVLIVVTDDQRASGTLEAMPVLREWLRDGGATFRNAYATTPFCCPSRASIITGLYSHNHEVTGRDTAHFPSANDSSVIGDFDDAGYQTGFYGKYLNGWPLDLAPKGFDDWAIMSRHSDWYAGRPWNVNGQEEHQDGRYSTHYIRDHALSFLGAAEEDDDAPWLLYLAPITPHRPATPEPSYEDAPVSSFTVPTEADRSDKPGWLRKLKPADPKSVRRQRASMLRSLMSIEDMLGSIRERLAADGEEDTIIVFTADNGLQWGEHGLTGKTTPYLPSVQVPLYVSWPGHVEPGSNYTNLVGLLDLAPTLLELTEVPTAKVFDGRSIFGESRRRLLLEYWGIANHYTPTWKAFLTRTFEYIEYYRNDGSRSGREAYDLTSDPHQLRNLFRDGHRGNPSQKKGALLARLASCSGPSCP